MKKIYIAPTSILNEIYGRQNVLQTNTLADSVNALQHDYESKDRDGGDMNFVSGSDEGASTSGFGSNDSPWEKLW